MKFFSKPGQLFIDFGGPLPGERLSRSVEITAHDDGPSGTFPVTEADQSGNVYIFASEQITEATVLQAVRIKFASFTSDESIYF